VARVDAALDEGALAVLEGTDDARHLGGEDAEEALDVADDHAAMRLEQRQREELDLLEVAAAATTAQGGKTDVRHDFEEFVGDVVDAMAGADGHGCRLCASGVLGRWSLPQAAGEALRSRKNAYSMINVDNGLSIARAEGSRRWAGNEAAVREMRIVGAAI